MKNFDDNLSILWKHRYKVLAFFSFLLVFGIIFFKITSKVSDEKYESMKQKYKLVENQDALSASVIVVDCNRGASMISLTAEDGIIPPLPRCP
jgi:hypothetical protein